MRLKQLESEEIGDRAYYSSLITLVKSFDSVLEVYEGFCNLKHVELKLKLSRGYSSRNIQVREAKLCSASKIVVGISIRYHTIHSSVSVAKYLAKKVSKDCCVLAIDNGKVMFQKDGSSSIIHHSQGNKKDLVPFRWNERYKVAVGIAEALDYLHNSAP